jgi:hypothetical protein
VEDSVNVLFTRHIFFVFFGGDEVGGALAGCSDFCLLIPLALLISFHFLGWWRPLDALSLGLVGATSSSCTWLGACIVLDGLPHLVDMGLHALG